MAELLAPAGSLEKLKYAITYGADAVYVGGASFSLRHSTTGFSASNIDSARKITKKAGKKLFVAVNIFAHEKDFKPLTKFLKKMAEIRPDALVVADPGVFSLAKEICPQVQINVSTQANVTNIEAARFWAAAGAKRITLARELSLSEIEKISKNVSVETEVFVHGAMCLSYSGRCWLSHHMSGRDANAGDCAQSCRWNYVLVEEQRPHDKMRVFEDDRGSYILSSKDLCLAEEIPKLIKAGVSSFKIEGRMKSAHYVATVTKVYREIIDAVLKDKENFVFDKKWLAELQKISHRQYIKGFMKGFMIKNGPSTQVEDKYNYYKTTDFVAEVIEETEKGSKIMVKNRLARGDELEVLIPGGDNKEVLAHIFNEEGQELDEVHANTVVLFKEKWPKMSLIRKMLECQQGRPTINRGSKQTLDNPRINFKGR